MDLNPDWIGQKVKVIFSEHWPISSAVYTLEGFDEFGCWVRNKYGVQRRLVNVDVADMAVLATGAVVEDEGNF
jgi:hypothetical protein